MMGLDIFLFVTYQWVLALFCSYGYCQKFVLPEVRNTTEMVFHLDDVEYQFVQQRVPWNVAKRQCERRWGSLAVLPTKEIAHFLALALVENTEIGEDWWIGAIYNGTNKHWMWIGLNSRIGVNVMQPNHSQNQFPTWAEDPSLNPNSKCGAFDRLGHEVPLFVNLPCTLMRPFLCQVPGSGQPIKPGLVGPGITIVNETTIFKLYDGYLTWDEAVAYCEEQGEYLATVDKPAYFTPIGKSMLRTRPVIEEAWIGGHYDGASWRWIHSDKVIPRPEIVTENSSLPWYYNKTIDNSFTCLTLDRHLCADNTFIEVDCNRRRPFVCRKDGVDTGMNKENKTDEWVALGFYDLWLYLNPMNWQDAVDTCRTEKNGHLLMLNTKVIGLPVGEEKSFMRNISLGMAHAKREVHHIWLGARFFSNKSSGRLPDELLNKWMWTSTTEVTNITKDLIVDPAEDLNKWNIVCSESDGYYYPCLNLDREHHLDLTVYGIYCKYKQQFICQAGKNM